MINVHDAAVHEYRVRHLGDLPRDTPRAQQTAQRALGAVISFTVIRNRITGYPELEGSAGMINLQ